MGTTVRSVIIAFGLLVVAGVGSYAITKHQISDAMAQGGQDAGVLDATTPPLTAETLPDVTSDPAAALSTVRQFWSYGVWQAIVLICLLIAAAIVRRMEPEDEDGDGKPDPVGWRGWTWTIAGALLLVGVPLLSIGTGEGGANWNAVGIGLVAALGLVAANRNPKRGEKATGQITPSDPSDD